MKKNITILDGGMGREIKKRLSHFDLNLWSASAFDGHEDLIVKIHRDYIEAGATVITTNNYAVVPSILEKSDRLDQFERLTKLSAELAVLARQNSANIQIAGSLPPLRSTYRPDLVPNKNEAMPIYNQIASWLAPNVDILLIESMSSIDEANSALSIALAYNVPVWISFILDDTNPTQILSGEAVSDIPKALQAFSIEAILFNCCQVNSITTALNTLDFDGKTGGYANAFKPLPKNWHHGDPRGTDQTMSPEAYTMHAKCWSKAGATIVGGCCEIGPRNIRHLTKAFATNAS